MMIALPGSGVDLPVQESDELLRQSPWLWDCLPYIAAAVCVIALGLVIFLIIKKRAGPSSLDTASAQLAEHAAVFSGLFEAVYRIGSGDSRYKQGVPGDFIVRLGGISGAEELRERLRYLDDFAQWDNDTGAKKMKDLTKFFIKNGIVRDSAAKIAVDGDTYARYKVSDGKKLYDGTLAEVIAPYWRIGDTILEKGLIKEDTDERN